MDSEELKAGDRVRSLQFGSDSPPGLEGTVHATERDEYGIKILVNWDRGYGPNRYSNPDRWHVPNWRGYFEIIEPDFDWSELELI